MNRRTRENEISLLVNLFKNKNFEKHISEQESNFEDWQILKNEIFNIKKNNDIRIGNTELELLFKYIIAQACELKMSVPSSLQDIKRKSLNSEIIDTINYYLINFKKKKLVYTKNVKDFLNNYDLRINDLFLLSVEDAKRINFNDQDWAFLDDFMKKYRVFFSAKVTLLNLIKTNTFYNQLSKRSKYLLNNFFKFNLNVTDFLEFDTNFTGYKRFIPNIPNNIGKGTYLEILDFFKKNFINDNTELNLFLEQGSLFLNEYLEPPNENQIYQNNLKDLADFTNNELSILLSEIKSLHFSFRTENSLTSFGLNRVGQIIFHGIHRIKYIPNMGKKSVDEILRTLSNLFSTNLEEIQINNWLDEDEILKLISEKKLKINYFHVLKDSQAKYIEDELIHCIETVSDKKNHLIFKNRYGLNEKQVTHTLQELADSKMYDNKSITRERIRQLIDKDIKKIKKFNVEYKKILELDNFITQKEILIDKYLDNYCLKNNLSNYINPTHLISVSKEFGLPYFKNINEVYVPCTGNNFFVLDKYEKNLLTFYSEILKNFTGYMFFHLNNHSLIHKGFLSLKIARTIIENSNNFILINENENYFVFKNFQNLDVRKNKLINLFGKIFRIVTRIDIQYLYRGVMSYRLINKTEKKLMSFELFQQYLSKLKIFKIEDNFVYMKYRPSSKHLATEDKNVLSNFFEFGRIIDSQQHTDSLIKMGQSEISARVTGYTNPFIISIKKGGYKKRGIYQYIFEKSDLYFDNLKDLLRDEDAENTTQNLNFSIDSKLKLQGLLKIKELKVLDGEYQIFDEYDNFHTSVKVSKDILYGLQNFSKKEKGGSFDLTFNNKLSCFYVSRI